MELRLGKESVDDSNGFHDGSWEFILRIFDLGDVTEDTFVLTGGSSVELLVGLVH